MKRWIIAAILLGAAALRLYALVHIPPSASLDEASIGWNAYSILKTGRDEYGVTFPLLLRAYDDFRPALYVYLVIPCVWLFGLTVFAVRLPSVVLSILTVYVVYLLGLLVQERYRAKNLGFYAAAILAISPWHIYISRLGHEANLGFALFVFGAYAFLRFVYTKQRWSLYASAVFLGLSLHGYQSEKIVTPLMIAAGGVLYWKELWQKKRETIVSGILFFVLALPAFLATISPQGMARFRGTSAFSPEAPAVKAATARYVRARAAGDRLGMVVHGRYLTMTTIAVQNYILHLSPVWLFTGEAREDFKSPGIGLLYPWEAVLLVLGYIVIFRKKDDRRLAWLLTAWVLSGPVPASLTSGAPHAMRAYTMLPPVVIIESAGLWYGLRLMSERYRQIGKMTAAAVAVLSLLVFWKSYSVRFPAEQSDAFQYAMKDAVEYARVHADDYSAVQFAHQGNLYQSYMFFLFYTRYDPARYHTQGGTVSGGYDRSHAFGKYSFGYLPDRTDIAKKGVLYFYDATLIPAGFRVIQTFTLKNTSPAIVAAVL